MLRNGIPLGKVFGIRLTIDVSWLVVFFVVCWNLATVFSTWHPAWTPVASLGLAFLAAVLFFGSVLAHELAHSIVARGYGIPVREVRLFLFGGVTKLEEEPASPEAELATTIVGPITSVGLGIGMLFVASVLAPLVDPTDPMATLASMGPMTTLLTWLGVINIGLGLFNLIPGFPLDGGRLLRALVWSITGDLRKATFAAAAVGQVIGWGFVVIGIAMFFGLRVPFLGQGPVAGLWLAFVGWFLASAARSSSRRVFIEEALDGVHVSQLMRRTHYAIAPEVSIADAVTRWFMRAPSHSFPVLDPKGTLLGLMCTEDVRKVPREAWPTTRVEQVMTPVTKLTISTPDEDASLALSKLAELDVEQLPVVMPGTNRFVGMLERRDLARWLELRLGPPIHGSV